MESLSIADLTEMVLMVSNAQDDQFQYWLSISFAVIVASFIAKEKITERLSIIVIIIYLLATLLLLVKYMDLGQLGFIYLNELNSRGIEWGVSKRLHSILRVIIYIFGTSTTCWFLYSNAKTNKKPNK